MITVSLLHQLGVRHACISPGSRNSSLTYAFIEKSEITCYSHIDERSSAYFGLGLAKSTQKPVVLVCTSGTAAANYFPAVIEASLSRVPLIILSADRPNYLVGTGANQTINQQNLYENHIRYFKDVGLPNDKFDVLQEKLEEAFYNAVGLDHKIPPGPVHLNFPFDEPLMPESIVEINIPSLTSTNQPKLGINIEIQKLTEAARPLIIAGPMEWNNHQEEIIVLAEKIKAPILADPISQLRYGFNSALVLAHYDIFLRYVDIRPDIILRFGRKPTSKVLCQLLDNLAKNTILVDEWQQYNDNCPNFIQSSVYNYCKGQVEKIDWQGGTNWVSQLLSYEKSVYNEIQSTMAFYEGTIAKICLESFEDGGQFFAGNSMPIRDVDMFTSTSKKKVTIFSNRGTSGIDGVISTALGMCAENSNSYSLLLIGDVSFYHDMNGLFASKYGMNLTIVVINNRGGGIFSFLPIADAGIDAFTQFWTTDTGLDLAKVAKLYDCQYFKIANLKDLRVSIQKSFKMKGIQIIEAKTHIEENVNAHKNFMKKIENALTPS